tara:strand:- start:373 stop:1023 length:651 start_codon:yes stop_codon:yes gene_type:complete
LLAPQSNLYTPVQHRIKEDQTVGRILKLAIIFIGVMSVTPSVAEPSAAEAKLKDIAIGNAKAPNTIIEYFSLTCGSCAQFHNNILPKLKKNFIETGKAKFIGRDFPLNNLAVLGHLMARCAPANRYYPYIDTLFHNFEHWTGSSDPVAALRKIARLGGMSAEKFDACLKDEKLFQAMRIKQEKDSKNFGIDSTPTIIVNGKKVDGTYEAIETALKK